MDQKDKILLGAFDLFMAYGVKSVSMDDIARKLGISKKTIYNCVENKKDLVKTVIIAFLKKDEEDIRKIISESESAIHEMGALARHINSFLKRMKPTLMFDLQKYHIEAYNIVMETHFNFIHDVIKNNIERGVKENLYMDDIDAGIMSKFYTVVVESSVNESLFPSETYAKTTLAKEHFKHHVRGLVNDKGRTLLELHQDI